MLYNLFNGVALGGINSALTNLVFDYVPEIQRADFLAFSQADSGLVGFLATLVVNPLVRCIQNSGNHSLGLPIYAQQVTSLIAMFFTILAMVYISAVLMKENERILSYSSDKK